MSDLAARYAVCEGVLRQGSFGDDVALARAAGFGAIGVDDAAVDAVGGDEAARILRGEGMAASSYMGLGSILTDDGSPLAHDELARRLDLAARLGARGALIGSGRLGARTIGDADRACRAWLERANALAEDRGVRIMLEPMHPLMRRWSYVHTLRHALTLVEGLAGAGIVLDVGHMWWEPDLGAVVRDHADDIVSVQVANIDRSALEEVRYERVPIADGEVPVAAIVRTLEAAGYRGWYEDETLARIPRDRRLDVLRSSRAWFEAL